MLDDPSFTQAARRIADEMHALPAIDERLAALTRDLTPPPI
jgi:hypothetical protein